MRKNRYNKLAFPFYVFRIEKRQKETEEEIEKKEQRTKKKSNTIQF